ncbi:MAG: phosphoribosylglycinamide formyltransferase [Planctomycetes bacterium]|nr:phosphoribosylglycinamide formyltransferase [Planctomycetota bacterium]
MVSRVKLGVLISGGGRTLQNFLDLSESGDLAADVVKVISSQPEAYGLERAKKADVPTAVLERQNYEDRESYGEAISKELDHSECDLVAMAGFMCFYQMPERYLGKVMNIHPALLPSFGGEGYYGDRVHRAVLEYGCKVTGCTVHFADNVYDHGPIIVQKTVAVEEYDDIHSLADRVFEKELEAYPEAINLFARERLVVEDRRVKILPA